MVFRLSSERSAFELRDEFELAEGVGNAPLCGSLHNGAYADMAIMRTCQGKRVVSLVFLAVDVRIILNVTR